MLKEKNNRQIDDVAFRILHAEDDPVLSAMVAAEFEDRGHAVVSAENGREALQRLGEREFDVALFDIDMPELSGLDVLAALREGETKNRRNLPAIMVTGNKGEDTIQQAYALGATSFVTKPLNIDLLARHLQFVMRADRNEMRLRAAVAAARKSERARLELVTRITHEMRTPLHQMSGFIDLILAAAEPAQAKTAEDFANEARYAIFDLNERLLSTRLWSGIVGDGIEVEVQETSGAELFGLACSIIRPVIDHARIELRCDADGLENLRCDPKLTARALANLLRNALDASQPEQVVTFVARRDGRMAKLAVRDEGVGLPLEELQHVAKPFSQGDSGLTRSSQGLGLGLSIAKAAAELQGGALELERLPEHGSRVTLVLPQRA